MRLLCFITKALKIKRIAWSAHAYGSWGKAGKHVRALGVDTDCSAICIMIQLYLFSLEQCSLILGEVVGENPAQLPRLQLFLCNRYIRYIWNNQIAKLTSICCHLVSSGSSEMLSGFSEVFQPVKSPAVIKVPLTSCSTDVPCTILGFSRRMRTAKQGKSLLPSSLLAPEHEPLNVVHCIYQNHFWPEACSQNSMQKLLLQAENRLFHCLSKLQQDCMRDISLQNMEKRLLLHLLKLIWSLKNRLLKGSRFKSSPNKETHQEPDKNNFNYFLWMQSVRQQGYLEKC